MLCRRFGVVDRLAAQPQGPHDRGVEGVFDFQPQDLQEEDVPDDLQAAARAAGTTADEHEQEQHAAAEAVPVIEIVRAEAGGGHDRDDLKGP